MPKIFISYRREDTGGHARHLFEELARRYGEKNVFMDVATLEGGERWADRIDQEVARSDAFIALIGRRWLDARDAEGNRRLDQPGDYVRGEVASGLARDTVTIPVLCTDDGLCSTALPMKAGPQAIQLGSDFGDRVIFPITVPAPGKIEVTAHWAGTAERLALILDGPKRPELADPVAYYARSDGASPLTVTYTVTAEDLERGRRFQVSLVNFSGGEAIGGIDIQAPEAFVFSHARLANLELGPMKPLKPVKPVKPVLVQPKQPVVVQPKKPVVARPIPGKVFLLKSQEQVCREGVQGKIAWNYQGNTSWAANNLERLCEGTTKGSEPARCFRHVMHGGVEWGGGTRWQWQNALDLCEGTSDATRTIRCFEAGIKRGWSWQRAIDRCETR